MRVTAAILAILAIPVWAGDFFIGDTAVGPGHPRGNLGRVVLSSDGETAYVFAKYGMNRVRPDGVVLDSEPFGLSEMFDPYSAAYGRGILVVTHQVINSLSANLSYATAVTTAGDILWSHFVAPTQAAVVYDGRDFVIVYHYEDSIRAAVLDENGFAARVMTLAAVSSVVRIGAPIVVRTDRGLLAVWRENGDIRAVPFDASGPRGDAITVGTGILSAGFGNELNGSFGVATNGDAALVVWANRLLEDPRTPWLAARHLDGDGVPIGAAIEIPLSDRAMDVEVVWDGAVYRMVWAALSADFRQLRLESASISPGAAEASAVEPVSSGTAMLSPSLTVAGGRATLAWNDRQHGGVRGKFANPGASFALAPEQVFRTVPYDAIAPAVAWSGQHYVTAWLRAPGIFADMSVVVRRFARDGTPLDGEARELAAAHGATTLRIASSGSETAVVWTDGNGRVLVSRIAADGTPLDPEPLEVATNAGADMADVASNGRRFVIVWADDSGVHARRLSARGGFVDHSPIPIAEGEASAARVIFDGSNFLVGVVSGGRLAAISLTPSGAVGEQVVISEEASFRELAVASNGSTHLFISAQTYVLASRDLREIRAFEGPYITRANAVWTGTTFVAAGYSSVVWISEHGDTGQTFIPGFHYNVPLNALATTGDGTALLVFTAPTRTSRASLYGRTIAPRRRAVGRQE